MEEKMTKCCSSFMLQGQVVQVPAAHEPWAAPPCSSSRRPASWLMHQDNRCLAQLPLEIHIFSAIDCSSGCILPCKPAD